MFLRGFVPCGAEDAEKYERLRWWAGLTFGDILDKAADVYPDKEALIDGRGRLTYSQVRERTDRLAVGLMGLGVDAQDRVLVQLPNWNEFVFVYFALQKIGAIPVLLIDRYRQHEIEHLVSLTGTTSWVVTEQYRETDYIPIIEGVLEKTPGIEHVILVRGKGHPRFLGLETLIEDRALTGETREKLAARRPLPGSVAHMGPTGGTTGLPKVVPRTHNDYLCRVEYAARAWDLDQTDTMLISAPVGHDLAFSIGLCSTFFTFGKVVMLDSTKPADICQAIERERVTAIAWVHSLSSMLISFDRLKDYDLSSLKKIYSPGGIATIEMITAFREKLGCVFINGYGGTEGMNAQTRLDDDITTVNRTVGKPTCPYDTYRVVDESGEELPPNTPGELVVKGPGIFTGYFNAPEENAKSFDEEGFFKTGDLAKIDDAGRITLTGRIREMIKRGGESISTVEIENLIIGHPSVSAVAVVGMPDPVLGEKACAYIQPKPGEKVSFDEIIAFLKEKDVSVLHLPERVEAVDSLPLTKAKKLDKRALEEDIKRKLGIYP
jgi:2,3-dihydroxybenzoate-AMP ligase/mycobactin salicyl-AMP ligase